MKRYIFKTRWRETSPRQPWFSPERIKLSSWKKKRECIAIRARACDCTKISTESWRRSRAPERSCPRMSIENIGSKLFQRSAGSLPKNKVHTAAWNWRRETLSSFPNRPYSRDSLKPNLRWKSIVTASEWNWKMGWIKVKSAFPQTAVRKWNTRTTISLLRRPGGRVNGASWNYWGFSIILIHEYIKPCMYMCTCTYDK